MGMAQAQKEILQYYKINEDLISGIAERQTQKVGLKLFWIPIISEEQMRKIKPDICWFCHGNLYTNLLEEKKII